VRVHHGQAFFKSQEQPQAELLRIHAAGNGSYDEVVVRFREGATKGHDSHHDAMKMYGNATSPQLYAVADDQQKLSIYSLPHPTENISIPLGFELAANKPASLTFDGAGSFEAGMPVWLEDRRTGTATDLRQTPSYSFIHEEEADPMRFVLHIGVAMTTGTSTANLLPDHQIYTASGQVHIHIPSLDGQPASIAMFDLLGRQLASAELVLGAGTTFDTGAFSGIAIVRVTSGQDVFTQRVLLK
jgi:hypothetical protein